MSGLWNANTNSMLFIVLLVLGFVFTAPIVLTAMVAFFERLQDYYTPDIVQTYMTITSIVVTIILSAVVGYVFSCTVCAVVGVVA